MIADAIIIIVVAIVVTITATATRGDSIFTWQSAYWRLFIRDYKW